MKRMFYLPELTQKQATRLMDAMLSHFRFYGLRVEFNPVNSELSYEMSSMGRTLYPDESSEAVPFKLGKGVEVDTIRQDEISAYVNGFYAAVK
jgi:hypothetical protein